MRSATRASRISSLRLRASISSFCAAMAWAVAFSRCKNCRAMAKASKNVSSAWKAVSPVVSKVSCLISALRESPSRADTREALSYSSCTVSRNPSSSMRRRCMLVWLEVASTLAPK